MVLASAFALGTSLVVYEVDSVFIAITCLLLLALKIFDVKAKHIAALLLCFAVGVLNAYLRAPRPDANDISKFCGQPVQVRAVVLEVKEMKSGKGAHVLLQCSSAKPLAEDITDASHSASSSAISGKMEASVVVSNLLSFNIEPGDSVIFQARLIDPRRMKSSHASRLSAMLSRKRVFCLCRIRASAIRKVFENPMNPNANFLELQASYWRESLLGFHRSALGAENGDLLSSIVLGDKAVKLGQDITDKFRACGLSHILAASGFNLSVVAIAIYFVLRFCVRNLWIANSICLLGMLVFVVIAGPSPSVVRACLMGALLLLSRCLSRSLHMPAALALTMLLVLLIDPGAAADVGFQLSYFSTAGMIFAASKFGHIFNHNFPTWPDWLREVLASTLVAQACVLPLQLYYFSQFNPYCLIANVVVAPMVPPLTIAGFAGCAMFAAESLLRVPHLLSVCVDKLCYLPVELLKYIVSAISSWPNAQINTGKANLMAVLFYYIILLLFPYMEMNEKLKLWGLLFILSLAIMLVSLR